MHLRQACQLWGLDDSPELVRRASNEVYRANKQGREVYLRITAPEHRAQHEIEAEVEWMASLHASGLHVVAPIASQRGRNVEVLGDNAAFAVVFEKGPGRQAHKVKDYTPEIAKEWGRLLAGLQKHSRTFRPKFRRPQWNEDRVFHLALNVARIGHEIEHRSLLEITDRLQTLSKAPEVFGLSHADLHQGNLTVDGHQIYAFDFDDSCYHWFDHDVAVGVVSIRKSAWEHPGTFDALTTEKVFVNSYREATESKLEHLELFLRYRLALSACWGEALQATEPEVKAWYDRSLPWWRSQLSRA